MARRRILADLTELSPQELKQELAAVQRDRQEIVEKLNGLQAESARLLMEEQVLAQMLRLHGWAEDGTPGGRQTLDAVRAAAPAAREKSLSANVLAVVRQAQQPLLPSEIQERLSNVGVEADLSAIRVALRRWRDRGALVKQGDRAYLDADAFKALSVPRGTD